MYIHIIACFFVLSVNLRLFIELICLLQKKSLQPQISIKTVVPSEVSNNSDGSPSVARAVT